MLSRIHFFVSLLLLVWIPVASGYAEENKTRITSEVELSDSNGLFNPNSPLNNIWEFTGNINDQANFNLDLKFKGLFRKNFSFFPCSRPGLFTIHKNAVFGYSQLSLFILYRNLRL